MFLNFYLLNTNLSNKFIDLIIYIINGILLDWYRWICLYGPFKNNKKRNNNRTKWNTILQFNLF